MNIYAFLKTWIHVHDKIKHTLAQCNSLGSSTTPAVRGQRLVVANVTKLMKHIAVSLILLSRLADFMTPLSTTLHHYYIIVPGGSSCCRSVEVTSAYLKQRQFTQLGLGLVWNNPMDPGPI